MVRRMPDHEFVDALPASSSGNQVTFPAFPATLASLNTQFEKGKEKWNEGADKVWEVAGEHGAPRV